MIWLPDKILHFFQAFSSSTSWKGVLDDNIKAPNNKRGMTYQTDQKDLIELIDHMLRRDNLVKSDLTITDANFRRPSPMHLHRLSTENDFSDRRCRLSSRDRWK